MTLITKRFVSIVRIYVMYLIICTIRVRSIDETPIYLSLSSSCQGYNEVPYSIHTHISRFCRNFYRSPLFRKVFYLYVWHYCQWGMSSKNGCTQIACRKHVCLFDYSWETARSVESMGPEIYSQLFSLEMYASVIFMSKKEVLRLKYRIVICKTFI